MKCINIYDELQTSSTVDPLNKNEDLLNRTKKVLSEFVKKYPAMKNEDADQISFKFQFIHLKTNCELVMKVVEEAEEFLKYGR